MIGRREFDMYETADWQVDALVDNLPELDGVICCPCVGDGSLMRRLQVRRPTLTFVTSDIVAGKGDLQGDATDPGFWERLALKCGPVDWVVENFPFSIEATILPLAFRAARVGLVAMARVSFCEPAKEKKTGYNRGLWLSEHPYQKRITLERHSFTGNGSTDSATTDWLVWSKCALRGPFGVSAYGYRSGRVQDQ